ncbi:uncharacterized protein EDB91DRAFT_1274408 [Suillus paluster]|uniref:uncharacterized protein n=1 Tax=Suillus paluster TaxID=48578 RepID=UPI001B86B1FA|nr:uncharacterized protein EDB91DRAFT_1274408 [Suillus paluster]KAG1743715.1 hypothetical protein EDB91DRAFT_1274408 [Suillus paluster]
MPAPASFSNYIDTHAEAFIKRLGESVAIKSISSDARRRQDVITMGNWLNSQLNELGVETKLMDLGTHEMQGADAATPTSYHRASGERSDEEDGAGVWTLRRTACESFIAVFGITVLSLGNQALKTDGWKTDPFTLVVEEDSGRLIGRGSTDDKGPIMGWLNVIEAHKNLGIAMPVNMRFCFEGMEENGSEGLDECIQEEVKKGKEGWFDGVDCVCISDNYWLNTRTPALTYGLRGIAYFSINITGPGQDLHSGLFGRTVHEPMTDLIKLMGKLVDHNGAILIPGIDDMIPPHDEEELKLYQKMDYTIDDIEEAAGGKVALSSDKATVLMGRMRQAIPFPARDSGCILRDVKHWNFEAAKKAIEAVYKKTPDYTREGGSIPVTLTFAESLGVNVLLLPMGRADDGAHSTNEKLDRSNFIEGTKVLGTYLYEVGAAA